MDSHLRFASRAPGRALTFAILSLLLFTGAGCNALGALASKLPKSEKAAYAGLTGKTVGVMVYADRGLRADWGTVQIDLANAVQNKLKATKAPELKGVTYPVIAASIVRYQRDHPGIDALPITDVAPKLGVQRLIYVEIESLSTRAEAALQMFRGSSTITLKVIEIDNGEAKIAYEEPGIRASFPPKTGSEGVMNSSDVVMYRGLIDSTAQKIVDKLTTHEVD